MSEFPYPKKDEVLSLIARTTFREFDRTDWSAFAGCESEHPVIGEVDLAVGGDMIIVIDGTLVNMVFVDDDFGGQTYEIGEQTYEIGEMTF
jgi:hypothetical protein